VNEPIPVVVLSSIDQVLRDTAIFSALTGAPRTGVLRQDLDPERGVLHRVISDETGVAEDEVVPLVHTCLGCAIREDSMPSLERMTASGRWDRILVALPVAAPTPPLSRPLAEAQIAADLGVRLLTIATAVDVDALQDNIFGLDLLADRDLALADEDRRTVGEALSAQIRHSDLLLTTGDSATGMTLADHLRSGGTVREDLLSLPTTELFSPRYFHPEAEARLDPCQVRPSDARDENGVWTLDLVSSRPVHPGRFMHHLDALAGGAVCSRGRFYLPSRPRTVGEWDGVAGQLSIGDAGSWPCRDRSTRLVFTGVQDIRPKLVKTFNSVLMTDREIAAAGNWTRRDDGFDDWLGYRSIA
jgi:G3E family GTPase